MGDSFGSGEGAYDYLPGTSFKWDASGGTKGCHRSINAWAVKVAAMRHYSASQWHFVACSGAEINTLLNANHTYLKKFGEDEPSQLDAVSPATHLVTLSIGGNDVGFADILKKCLIPGCHSGDFADGVEDALLEVQGKGKHGGIHVNGNEYYGPFSLAQVYEQIAYRMTEGRILVTGYPTIFGDQYTKIRKAHQDFYECPVGEDPKTYPFYAKKDVQWIGDIEARGNKAIRDQVAKANEKLQSLGKGSVVVRYVDVNTNNAWAGHAHCDTKDDYFNDLTIKFPGKHKPLQESMHPSKMGQFAYFWGVRDMIESIAYLN